MYIYWKKAGISVTGKQVGVNVFNEENHMGSMTPRVNITAVKAVDYAWKKFTLLRGKLKTT